MDSTLPIGSVEFLRRIGVMKFHCCHTFQLNPKMPSVVKIYVVFNILSKEGYPNIVSLGTKAGSRKTTKGTPDTYFYTADEKYIFVEYTTQIEQLNKK